MRNEGIIVKLCILCHPSDLIADFIPDLLDNFEGETTQFDYSFLGVKPATFKLKINYHAIKFLLIYSVNHNLLNKLRPYYRGAWGAFIIFSSSNQESYKAAKDFYQYFRKITLNPDIPVIFIEIHRKPTMILIENGEKLESKSNEVYYEINKGDLQRFRQVFETNIMEITSSRIIKNTGNIWL